MPQPIPEPRVGAVYEFDGARVVLERPHVVEPNVWIAHLEVAPNTRRFVGRPWLLQHAPLVEGTGEVQQPAPQPVAPVAQEVPVESARAGRRRDTPAPEPVIPHCPACNEAYQGELGTSHRCARVLECTCMGCGSIAAGSLASPRPPEFPYLCNTCVSANVRVCKTCAAVVRGVSRSISICDTCNPLQPNNIWGRMNNQARGNDIYVETASRRAFACEVECYIMPGEVEEEDGTPGIQWDRASDGSIRPENGALNGSAREFRSPPFRGDGGLAMLSAEIKKIRQMGYRANKSCGFHVHVDAIDLKDSDLSALNRFGGWIQDDIFKLVATSRVDNQYCQKLGSRLTSDRYMWWNLKPSWTKHRTVEFRLHHGITMPERATEWVKVCLSIVEMALRLGYGNRRPTGNVMDLLGFTKFQKDYWTAVSKALHGAQGITQG